jgi:CRISPR-associated protein (TIGR03986 family)
MSKEEQKTWTFHASRWQIKARLFTDSPLHIGSGDTFSHSELKNEETGKHIQINACIKDGNSKPYLPATTLKGKLYAWLKSRIDETYTDDLKALFGTESDKKDFGFGGKAKFHNALLIQPLTAEQAKNYPYWNQDSQTYIEVGIAINRHTRTVDHRKLFHSEAVPPNVGFEVIITGMMTDTQAGLLISVLQAFPDRKEVTEAEAKPERAEALKAEPMTHGFNSAATFGSDDTSGKGRMYLSGKVEVSRMDKTQVCNWLNRETRGMVEQAFIELNKEDIAKLTAPIKPFKQREVLNLTIQMDGGFLINNPEVSAKKDKIKDKNDKEPDQQPLKDAKGKPLLTGKSLRGALRSQAEKIMRTLGIDCCDTTKPCPAIYHRKDVETKLCPVCQVFGATGWQSPLHIHPFKYVQPDIEQGLKTQNFVAIDRFHGGGKHSALFNTRFALKPCFKGAIELDDRLPDCGKGLLALVLRDLHEGDIKLGFGANKGYGGVKEINLDKPFTDADVIAFRTHFNIRYEPHLKTISKADEQALPPANPSTTGFHNPYHFIPVKEPNTDTWLNRDDLNTANNPHSHALYRKERHHGRIHCTLTAETPFFIGDKKDEATQIVKNYQFNGELAIPATSLRGMISSLAEAASNSAMRVLDNGLLSYRKQADDALQKIGMVIKQGDDYKCLVPCEKRIKLKDAYSDPVVSQFIADNKTWTPDAPKIFYIEIGTKEITAENLPKSENDLTIARRKDKMQSGILRILGKDEREEELPEKKHEWFIPVTAKFAEEGFIEYSKTAKLTYRITDEALTRFEQLADQRTASQKNKKISEQEWLPFHLKGMEREADHSLSIKAGDLVYYHLNGNEVDEISFSAIWRGRVEDQKNQAAKVFNFFPRNLLPFNKDRETLSPAEMLFGFIEADAKDALAFAGKVRINTGQLINPNKKKMEEFLDDTVMLKILASPKLPSPALYFRNQQANSQNNYIAKHDLNSELHEAKGRKYYLHALRHSNGTVQKLSQHGTIANNDNAYFPWRTHPNHLNDNKEQKVTITPIKSGSTFSFTVDFDNLSDYELGLLCYALRPSKQFRHKFGMGKPLGLGTVKIAMTKLEFIDRHKRYAEETLDATRYNGQTLDMKSLRNHFIQTMDKDIHQALELLGNPAHVKAPVHYPQINNQDIEQETYQWFVKNDKQSKQQLSPLNQNSTQLPTLKRS